MLTILKKRTLSNRDIDEINNTYNQSLIFEDEVQAKFFSRRLSIPVSFFEKYVSDYEPRYEPEQSIEVGDILEELNTHGPKFFLVFRVSGDFFLAIAFTHRDDIEQDFDRYK